ncbi:MAG: lysylphosphatidylglycerol synthase domain-containing protein [Planctomycetota bacterium]
MPKLILSAAVAVGALALLLYWGGIEPAEVWATMRSISPATFGIALGIQGLIYVFRAARLRTVLRVLMRSGAEDVPGARDLTAASAAWILDSHVLPAKIGEASLVLHLGRVGVAAEHGLVGLLLSRLFDLLVLSTVLGLTCLALGWSGARPELQWLVALGVALLAGSAVLAFVIVRGGAVLGGVRRGAVRMGVGRSGLGSKIMRFTERVETALGEVDRGTLLRVAAWSLPVWAAVLGVYVVLGTGVGLIHADGSNLRLFDLLFGASLAIFGSLVPISGFLGFGVLDIGWAWGFAAVGVDEGVAVATGLAFHTLYLAGVGLLGAIGHAVLIGRSRRRSKSQAAVGTNS